MSNPAHGLFWKIHKYAGLTACAWLLVLGVTGFLLDHHEWRWLNQTSVPATWTSKQIGRLVPGTVIRHIAVSGGSIMGASERGAWYSRNRGKQWMPIKFAGEAEQPQVHAVAGLGRGSATRQYLATDDGLWLLSADQRLAQRAGLDGDNLTSMSEGYVDGTLVVVRDRSTLLQVEPGGRIVDIPLRPNLIGVGADVPIRRVVMDIHFGRGLLGGRWSVWLNDLGGLAMTMLSVTGLGYWWVTRPGRRRGLSISAQRGAIRWLFRSHGPVIGLVAVVPIFYLSITALPLNHIYGFIASVEGKSVSRAVLPPAYRLTTFDDAIDGVAAWPSRPGRISLATRLGMIESRDNGQSWRRDLTMPVPDGAPGANLFRTGTHIFAGIGGGDNFMRDATGRWERIDGPSAAITSMAPWDGGWMVKDSRSFFVGRTGSRQFTDVKIPFKAAAPGTPLFLFVADVHAGVIFHEQFKWLNDLFAVLAILLALSGPVIWFRRKWI